MTTWSEHVKKVHAAGSTSFKESLKRASASWKKAKGKAAGAKAAPAAEKGKAPVAMVDPKVPYSLLIQRKAPKKKRRRRKKKAEAPEAEAEPEEEKKPAPKKKRRRKPGPKLPAKLFKNVDSRNLS